MNYTQVELENKTTRELRVICLQKNIPNASKMTKSEIISKIISSQDTVLRSADGPAKETAATVVSTGMPKVVSVSVNATLKDENAPDGMKYSKNVFVSYGAFVGEYPLSGMSIEEGFAVLKDILNINPASTIVLNGKIVKGSEILKSEDKVEFVRPSGQKG